jgi:hypothetical protein
MVGGVDGTIERLDVGERSTRASTEALVVGGVGIRAQKKLVKLNTQRNVTNRRS